MAADSGRALDILKVDGGMTANGLLMQFQADVLGVPVVRPSIAETTCLGAAYAAGLAVGFWPDLETLRAQWRKDAEWSPNMDPAARDKGYAQCGQTRHVPRRRQALRPDLHDVSEDSEEREAEAQRE